MNQIKQTLELATPEQVTEGKVWYTEAHNYAVELSEEFNLELNKVCAVISAMSPLKHWNTNKKIARQFLEGKRNVHTKLQMTKAEWILEGKDVEMCLGGQKTVNFYWNILNPSDTNWCTIDRHIIRMFNQRPSLTVKQYSTIKNQFVSYSQTLPDITCNVQAICWIVMRTK